MRKEDICRKSGTRLSLLNADVLESTQTINDTSNNMQKDMATTAVPSWPEWYNENLESLNDDTRAVLENYSGLSSERVIPHVTELVRSRESRLCYVI